MPISRKDLIKKFKSLGFIGPYSGGRHQFMVKGKLKIRIPNPHKSGEYPIHYYVRFSDKPILARMNGLRNDQFLNI